MKSKLLGIALLFPMVAFADNTVTFLGEVSDSTCDVTINGASGNISVLLPTTTVTALSTAGATTEATPFNFVVSGCTAASQSNVGMRLVPLSTTTSGTLTNIASTSTAAAGVAIQIVDGSTSTPIDFSDGEYSTTTQTIPSSSTGTLTFPFTARYYSLATTAVPVTSGKVESQLQYALTYN